MSQPPPPASPSPPPAAAPAKSGNRVLVIILCVVLGFVLLVGGCVGACVYVAAKKAREFNRSMTKNPAYTRMLIAASILPEVEIVSKDEAAGKITVRNKRTGEVQTFNANDYTAENLDQALDKMVRGAKAAGAAASRATASPEAAAPTVSAGKASAMATILAGFPDFVPAYPGGTTLAASQNTLGGNRAGNYVFSTPDQLSAVVGFYEKKAAAAGFTVSARNGSTNDFGPTASLSLNRMSPLGTVVITAESQDGGQVKVSIDVTEVGK